MDSDDITKARSAFEIFRDEHFQRERAAGRHVNWSDEEFWVMLKAEFGALSDEDRQYYTDLSETSAGLAKVNRLRKKDEEKQTSAANTPISAKKMRQQSSVMIPSRALTLFQWRRFIMAGSIL